ncbi:MAG: C_GCAxxG_C_C family protein [Lachnospiraceae bacterium]|nr:C_GCAxxG_C_C family protein [Lachnospiraceae bacterium]
MKAYTTEQIADFFKSGIDCSQVVIEAFSEETGLKKEEGYRIGAAFGGGMGVGETCGAVTGAMIVLGCLYGHDDTAHMEKKDVINAKRAAFLERFQKRHDSFNCNGLLKHDIADPAEFQKILEEGLLFDFCPRVAKDCMEIVQELIAEG